MVQPDIINIIQNDDMPKIVTLFMYAFQINGNTLPKLIITLEDQMGTKRIRIVDPYQHHGSFSDNTRLREIPINL